MFPELPRNTAIIFDRPGFLHRLVDCNLTRRRLAHAIGLKPDVLHHIVYGQMCKPEIQKLIANAVGLEPSDLWHEITFTPKIK
jgi:lambda repressor-like predicted transcriptional regulator